MRWVRAPHRYRKPIGDLRMLTAINAPRSVEMPDLLTNNYAFTRPQTTLIRRVLHALANASDYEFTTYEIDRVQKSLLFAPPTRCLSRWAQNSDRRRLVRSTDEKVFEKTHHKIGPFSPQFLRSRVAGRSFFRPAVTVGPGVVIEGEAGR